MQQILIIAIAVIGAVFLGLTLLIVANKAWREGRQGYRRNRRTELEPQVLAYAHGYDPTLREVLGERDPGDGPVLEEILLDHLQRVRGVAHARLGRAYDEMGFVDEHLAGLESSRWWRRADAAEKLGLAGAERATESLIATMHDEVPEVRLRAAKALGALGGPEAARPLVHALNEPSRWSTIRIADILTGMGREVVPELLDAFPELSLPGKLALLDVVARVRPLRALPWLLDRVLDYDADVRARACHALGAIGDPEAAAKLVRALGDDEWPVRAMAAKALGRIRHQGAVESLGDLLRDDSWWVRSNAATALVSMGRTGIEALEAMLEDDDRYARHQAVIVLEQGGIVDERVGRLAEPGDGQRAARRLVERLVRVGRIERLRMLSREHPDDRIRAALLALLPPPEAQVEATR